MMDVMTHIFLIVDRLTETLEDRIVRWRKMEKKLNSPWCRRMDRKGRKISLFMIERLKVAVSIASAVTYMHSKRIIYRDIKPTNIGFDIENKVKVFDFGLCGKLPEGKDGGFHVVHALPGGIGTYG
jgi:serine/threonine protein kinase